MSVRTLESTRQVTRIGAHSLEETGELAAQQGIHHALIVTDAGLSRTHWRADLERSLRNADVDVSVFSDVHSTPGLEVVAAAIAAIRDNGCDGVVSLGGGSCHDVAKVAALLTASRASFHAIAHGERAPDGKLPHVAVNTTAGSGAERSGYAFIMEEKGHEHTVVHHKLLVPEVAVLDPRIHVGMPPALTADSGLNALAHAIEAFLSTAHTDGSDERALKAIGGIMEHLPRAVSNGSDVEVREAMAEASYQAAEAFDAAGLGIVDSISLVLSSLFSIGQSSANGMILPYVMQFDALAVDGPRTSALCEVLGVEAGGGSPSMADAVQAVQHLRRKVGQSESLADRGVSWDDLYLVSHAILRHPFTSRNPRPLDKAGLAEIFLDALQGESPGAAVHSPA